MTGRFASPLWYYRRHIADRSFRSGNEFELPKFANEDERAPRGRDHESECHAGTAKKQSKGAARNEKHS